MGKITNLFIVFILILAIGVFAMAEVWYCEFLFPELNETGRGGVILYSGIVVILVIAMQFTRLVKPKESTKKKNLTAIQEVRNELIYALFILVALGIGGPLCLLAVVWVL